MKKLYLFLTLLFLLILNSQFTSASRVDNIDIIHYNLHLSIRNLSNKNIHGIAEINAIAKNNVANNITLDLQKLIVDSVFCNGMTVSFVQPDTNSVQLTLNKTYQINDTLALQVYYHGSPSQDKKWGGFFFSGDYAYNMGVGMASNPPSFGRCWFPCIDNFTDRATFEFHITTDSGYIAVCNGLQAPATPNIDGSITWNWELHQSIPTYQANVAVSKYVLINNVYHGIKRDIPIVLAVQPSDTIKLKASFKHLNDALACFESKFGPYMFDRVGYVAVPFNGGAMEHASNISYPISAIDGSSDYETLFAHELSHHWFGNLVTANNPSEMWLNEGWANYCEALFLECVYGKSAYNDDIKDKLFTSLRWSYVHDGGYYPVNSVPLAQTYGTTVYSKGALMVHNLRTFMGDSAFFKTIKKYLIDNSFSDVTTEKLEIACLQSNSQYRIDDFFEVWLKDKGEIDFAFVGIDSSQTQWMVKIALNRKHKTKISDFETPISLSFYLEDGRIVKQNVLFKGNSVDSVQINKIEGIGKKFFCVIDEDHELALATTNHKEWIKTKGSKPYADVLFTANVQQVNDSALLYVEHHFTKPYQLESNLLKNIRVSNERYWTVKGFFPADFKTSAFLNYDGTTPTSNNSGFLDNELITGNEDSIVLLYRTDANAPFVIHIDNTKEMGGNTDKTGRFIVNKLAIGDYAFGYYDFKAGTNSIAKPEYHFKIYPNPSEGKVSIEFGFEHKDGILEVIDMSGKTVYELKIKAGEKDLEIKSTLNKGTYIIRFKDAEIKTSSRFIVI